MSCRSVRFTHWTRRFQIESVLKIGAFPSALQIAYRTRQNRTPKLVGCVYPPAQPVQSLARVQRHKGEFEQPQNLKYPYGFTHKT
jgi:hypothetical protein